MNCCMLCCLAMCFEIISFESAMSPSRRSHVLSFASTRTANPDNANNTARKEKKRPEILICKFYGRSLTCAAESPLPQTCKII